MARTITLPPLTEIEPLRDFGKKLPNKPDYHTVRGWAITGRVAKNSKHRVKLQIWRMPYGLATTMSAYMTFLEKLQNES